MASRSPSSARPIAASRRKASAVSQTGPDDVADDRPVIWNGIHVFDSVRGLVERGPQQIVHPGVGDDEGLAALLLDVEHARQQHAGGPGDRAAGLDEHAEGPAGERGQHRRGVGFRRHAPLSPIPMPPPMSSVSIGNPAAARSCASADEIPGRRGQRTGLQDLAPDVRLDADHPDAGQPAGLLEDLRGARPMSTPNLFCLRPVEMYGWDFASMSGLTRRATRATLPPRRAIASIFSISRSDSALKARIPAATPAAISSSVLPTPEKTIRSAGIPHWSDRAQLAARDDVGARAEARKQRQDREVRVGLGGVADEVGDRGKRRVEAPEVLLDQRPAVDVEGSAELPRRVLERHAVAEELRRLVARIPPSVGPRR